MSNRLPALTGADVVRALARGDFVVARISGSHYAMRHPSGRRMVVPVHASETLGPGLMARILRDCELSREQFRALL